MIFWVLLKIISCKNVKLLKAKSSFIKCKVTIAVIFLSMQLIVSMIMLLIKQKRLTKKLNSYKRENWKRLFRPRNPEAIYVADLKKELQRLQDKKEKNNVSRRR